MLSPGDVIKLVKISDKNCSLTLTILKNGEMAYRITALTREEALGVIAAELYSEHLPFPSEPIVKN